MSTEADQPTWSFPLDRFQREAIDAFDGGESVLVAAPTGAGKTVIAVHAMGAMLNAGRRSYYTSPIKALANQKYRDLGERFGPENVGLATGDLTIRPDAAIVVMTTEVLRNMLYERIGALRGLGCVVLDEVHYLQDRARGPVWEEVLLHLPADVRTVALSATVSNLDEFVDWLRTVRGATALVVEHERPVPLDHLLAVSDRESTSTDIVPLVRGSKLSEEARRFAGSNRSRNKRSKGHRGRGSSQSRKRGRQGASRSRWAAPRRSNLSRQLHREGLGPIIWFVFSRAGCDEAVEQCHRRKVRFTDDDQADRLEEILREATSEISDDDWFTLGLGDWEQAFYHGIASHHAGLVPSVKEAVEIAFAEGLIGVVFATETLALGVNLPARTVVLERMVKFDGEQHSLLTPLEFTQLTGRAGRRGLDDSGHAVVCWSARTKLDDIARLALSRDYPLRSAFAPNYNMVANLMRRHDAESAKNLIGRSFGQFQRDRTAVEHEAKLNRLDAKIADEQARALCERGDIAAFMTEDDAAHRVGDDELGQLRPGSVFSDGGGIVRVAVSVAHRGAGVVVRTVDGFARSGEWHAGSLPGPLGHLGVETLPSGMSPSSDAAGEWAKALLDERYPHATEGMAGCPDFERHQRALVVIRRLERDRTRLVRRHGSAVGALVAEFDEVAKILHDEGFARDWNLTPKGRVLAGVHGECEAVLAEAIERGLFDQCTPPELCAVLSSLVWEPRGDGDGPAFGWPSKTTRRVCVELQRVADRLISSESSRLGRSLTRRPDPSLTEIVHRWALGDPLADVLGQSLTGGDFVRTLRQVIDLSRQVSTIATGDLAETASEGVFCLDRGVVRSARDLPWSSIDDADVDDGGADEGGVDDGGVDDGGEDLSGHDESSEAR